MRTVVAWIAAIALAGACKSAESKGAPPPSGDPVATGAHRISVPGGGPETGAPIGAGTMDKGGAPGGADTSFNLQIAAPAAGKAGTETVAHVVVTPGSGYHVNQDFPTRLVIAPTDGVKVAKAEQAKEDAATFNETKLAFDVKLTADKPGTYKVAGTLKFAVCTESSCDPKKREIAFELAAQ